MKDKPAKGLWIIALSFFLAYLLAAVPLPQMIALARPDWVGLFLIFWVLVLPERVGITVGFGVGLLQDVVLGTYLGVFALSYSCLVYLVLLLHQRLRMYPILQQALVVFLIIAVCQLLVQWCRDFLGSGITGEMHLLPSLVSAFMWPWVYVILRSLQMRFRVQ
jgi:rod shape-determining protein MreD